MKNENYIEPRTLKLTEIDHDYYLKLADVERLLHDMRRAILDHAPYEKAENGLKKYRLDDAESDVLNELYFVSSCIKRQLVLACETPDEIRALRDRIYKAYYHGKYYLCTDTTDENGEKQHIYFRKYCPGALKAKMEEEGATEEEIDEALMQSDGEPTFTTDPKYAWLFESMEEADRHRTHLNYLCEMNLDIRPAFMLDNRVCKDFLDKLLKEPEDEAQD